MPHRRPSAAAQSAVDAALNTLVRDGAASVTVEALADLSLAAARHFRERFSGLPVELRLGIVSHMAASGDEDIRLAFERALLAGLDDPDPDVRLTATRGLWEVESSALLNALLKTFRDETSARVRVAQAEALGRFARLASEDALEPEERNTIESLLRAAALDDGSEAVRLAALAAASYLRSDYLGAEIARAYDDGHDEAREFALRAMGRFGGGRWARRVIDALITGDEDQRVEAALAAPYVEDRGVIPYLYEAAEDDESEELQLAAIGALGEIGGPNVTSFLEALRDSTAGDVAEAAEAALEQAALLEGSTEIAPVH